MISIHVSPLTDRADIYQQYVPTFTRTARGEGRNPGAISRARKVRGGIISPGTRELVGFCSIDFSARSYWLLGSEVLTLSEKGNAFLSPLKNKGFKEESLTRMRVASLNTSTTLESNKSQSAKAVDADAKGKVGEARWRRKDHQSLG
jgi:hypothetical protein